MPTIPIRWSDNTAELKKNLAQGLNQIEATRAAAEKMAKSLGGENLLRAAGTYAAAVERLGGAANLTASNQARVNSVMVKAVEQLEAAGRGSSDLANHYRTLAQQTAQVEKPTGGLTARMLALSTALGSFGGTLAADAFRRIASGLLDVAANGIKLAPIVGSFQSLTRAVGESGDAMLRAARTATKGLIGDLDLMQAANKGLLLGLPITAQSFGLLSQTAVVLGKAMGQGPVKSFDDLITALGRSSPMILDNLGLSVKVGEANDQYAQSIGKTAEQLTDAEKKLAFYNAAMDAAKKKVEEVGGLNLTLADRVQQAKVAFSNFTNALGVAVATSPVLNAALGTIGDALTQAFGANQTVMVQRLGAAINQIAIPLADVASVAVSSGKYLSLAFYGTRVAVFAVMEAVNNLVYTFLKVNATIAETVAAIPGIGRAWRATAEASRYAADVAGSLSASYKKTKDDAIAAMGDTSRSFDAAGTAVDGMRARMVAASTQVADSDVIAQQLVKTTDALGAVTTSTSAATAESAKTRGGEIDALGRQRDAVDKLTDSLQKSMQAVVLMRRRAGGTELTEVFDTLGGGASRQKLPTLQTGSNPSLPQSFSANFSAMLQNALPKSIMNAIQGGGSVIQAAGSTLGGFLTSAQGFGKQMTSGLTSMLGNGLGAAASALLPGIGSLMGPLLGKLTTLLSNAFGGPSKQEMEGRDAEAKFEQRFQSFEQMVNRIGDAYAATGRSREEAQRAVQDMLDAERQGADAVNAAIENLQTTLDASDRLREGAAAFGMTHTEMVQAVEDAQDIYDYMVRLQAQGEYTQEQVNASYLAWQQAMADSGNEAAKAWIAAQSAAVSGSTAVTNAMQSQIDTLQKSIANEAPEAVKGAIETQVDGQIAALKAAMEDQQGSLEQNAQTSAENATDVIRDAFSDLELHVPIVYDLPNVPGLPGPEIPLQPMADGGTGRATGPMFFYTAGNEDYAFSGEGKRFGDSLVPGGLMPDAMSAAVPDQAIAHSGSAAEAVALRSEVSQLRSSFEQQTAYFNGRFPKDLARAVRDSQRPARVGGR